MNDREMKAILCPRYGAPDVLEERNVPRPTPNDNEVLIKVHASSINAYDDHIMRGSPLLVRIIGGLTKPRGKHSAIGKILGADVAGTVVQVGKNTKNFSVGDEVYGCLADGSGDSSFAEYATAKESVLAPMAKGMTMEQAASIPMAAVTALQGLRDVGKIKKGQKVLINGASGGVGSFAVQLAKAFGTEVTGVCSARNADMARALGADHVLDYAKTDFAQTGDQYDLILDIVPNHSLKTLRGVLRKNGTCAVAGFSGFGFVIQMMLWGKSTHKKDGKRIELVMAKNTKGEDLLFINALFEEKKIKPVIDCCYPISEVRQAFTYFENEHAKGKVVLKISD